jgi:heme o synthase
MMSISSDPTYLDVAQTAAHRPSSWVSTLIVLFKLRIVALLLFAGIGGAFIAAGGVPTWSAIGLLCFGGGLAAAGASALNQYLEAGLDALMGRTRRRPLVTQAIAQPVWVPYVGLGLIVGPVLIVAPFNWALAFWSLAGALVYVGVYTIWLKPRTVLNIVIGGLAGSCAVLSGGAAVGNWADPGVLGLALLLFLWTPTHFWSLAIVYRDDYAKANVPMLPARTTLHRAAFWILFHSVATGVVAVGLSFHAMLGLIYLAIVLPATGHLLWQSYQLLRSPQLQQAKALFMTSNLYLTLILLAICLNVVLGK